MGKLWLEFVVALNLHLTLQAKPSAHINRPMRRRLPITGNF
jgi:hypothetical protein